MPALLAMVLATAAAWLADGAVRPLAGPVASMVVGTVAAAVAFFVSKRFFTDLRG